MLRLLSSGSGGSGRPLLPHGDDRAGGRPRPPPSPSKAGKGWTKMQRRMATALPKGGTTLVLLVPTLFFLVALLACWILLRSDSSSPPRTLPHAVLASDAVQSVGVRPRITEASLAEEAAALVSSSPSPSPGHDLPSLLVDDGRTNDPSVPSQPTGEQTAVRWLAHWLALRGALDALVVDLKQHFPPPAEPAPIVLPPSPRPIGASQKKGWIAQRSTVFQPPAPPRPPLQGWAAGLPAFPEFFCRDAFVSFLLLFPLPRPIVGRDGSTPVRVGYEGPWDLRTLAGSTSDAQPTAFPFAHVLSAHPSVASTALDDLLRIRTQLRVAARTQGKSIDRRTGEEPGKIAHQIPGRDMLVPSPQRNTPDTLYNTRFAASDTTALFILSSVHYFHATGNVALLSELLPALAHAYAYLARHVDPASGLVFEHPSKFLSHSEQGDTSGALRITYWKDSVLLNRLARGQGAHAGAPTFPVSFLLLQAQTLAALRGLRSLRSTLSSFSSPSADSRMAQLLSEWDQLLAASEQTDLEGLIVHVRDGLHSHFFRRVVAVGSASTSPLFPRPAAHPAATSCPRFGVDGAGSLGAEPGAAESAKDPLRTSDALHALYFLERDDVSAEELAAWFRPSSSEALAQNGAAMDDAASADWQPGCFQQLETPIGFATSNLGRTSVAPFGSQPDSSSEDELPRMSNRERAIAYHHRSVWPMEQALIHSAAHRFALAHVEEVAGRFFRRFERALLRRRKQAAESGTTEVSLFPEYFLPDAYALKHSSADQQAHLVMSLRGSRKQTTFSRELWQSQGATLQLWTAAAWSYWITQQSQKAFVHALPPAQPIAPNAPTRCQSEPDSVLRGVPVHERSRYCPSASSSVPSLSAGAFSSSAFPTAVFLCLDGSSLQWLSAVNDQFCDCLDGSDERGTAACAHSDEEHAFAALQFDCGDPHGTRVFASAVDDGVCDCCNGADETSGLVQCPIDCDGRRALRMPVPSAWRVAAA